MPLPKEEIYAITTHKISLFNINAENRHCMYAILIYLLSAHYYRLLISLLMLNYLLPPNARHTHFHFSGAVIAEAALERQYTRHSPHRQVHGLLYGSPDSRLFNATSAQCFIGHGESRPSGANTHQVHTYIGTADGWTL